MKNNYSIEEKLNIVKNVINGILIWCNHEGKKPLRNYKKCFEDLLILLDSDIN